MLYMVIETYDKDAHETIYARFHEHGRMLPAGLEYIDSWVSLENGTCYQLMRTNDARLFDEWASKWNDLVHFKIEPVMTSQEAARRSKAAE